MKKESPLAVAVLAAGKGKRMKSQLSKVLFEICGRPALFYPVNAAQSLDPDRFLLVIGWDADKVRDVFCGFNLDFVVQKELKGTGHALLMTREKLSGFEGDLLVLYGDGPLIRPETLERILDVHRSEGNIATVLTAVQENPTGYGRVVRDGNGAFLRIVEEKDADETTRMIKEINTGITVYRCPEVFQYMELLQDDNVQKEFYLTDLPQIISERGRKVGFVMHHDATELDGFNDLAQYADLRKRVQARIMTSHLSNGVQIVDPSNTYIDQEVEIGPGTRILPFTVIQGKVKIGVNCNIGPFAYLRGGAELEEDVGIGAFVEVKNSFLGRGTLSRHLAYIGDASVGSGANVGAGAIFANFDGRVKNRTIIGDRAFIGSGSVIVAPAEVGEGCTIGAGAVVTRNTHTEPGSVYTGVPARRREH